MKRIAGLVIVVAMVLGVMTGCTAPSEPVYRDLSVGPMTVNIPDDWQNPDNYSELMAEILGEYSSDVLQADIYEDESDGVLLIVKTISMASYAEENGWEWGGWEAELAAVDMSSEEYAGYIQEGLMEGATNIALETTETFSLGGLEAWEFVASADDADGDLVKACVLVVFAEDDFGMLMIVVEEGKWGRYEATWDTIKNSVTM